ncbi:MAG TPA: DUF5060 domain-containing protein [Aggregatilinea sp.]|uniref:DUF5060 domain-containing protein n=1 Tax=Aggregatilinea sp. TaxID=2806333 RepID=UPI002BF995F0|nr:DUF5060 domain-containing protein [Aggregatilinea sp.]HML20907.1 DUF5060 domain-containing protein [Aggregatilinea sp.]
MAFPTTVEQWGIFELELNGPHHGNPFLSVSFGAEFRQGDRRISVNGFYDGDGCYRVRFMPDAAGEWQYTTYSSAPELADYSGTFTSTTPGERNHGVVRVRDTYHFAYDDGTPYYPFGTTCYAWTHQGEALEQQTLESLRQASFNKVRMCVFPKHYPYNENEPVYYPFERDAAGEHDFTRFSPAFFRHLEQRISDLLELGIEADVIIFHPYDRWGYAGMDEESDYRYLRYLIARLAAYRNVWWSLANEYDFLLQKKPIERWDRFFEILRTEDPVQHLRSIHNGDINMNYDHTKPGVTHVSIQNWDAKRVREWRATYTKPVINDELEYEGNIPFPWGNITAQEVVHRFWIMVSNGGYAGHGETYEHPEDLLWWAKGGTLRGESWQRIAFLRQIVEEAPAGGLNPIQNGWIWTRVSGGMNGDYRLIYLGEHQPLVWEYGLPEGTDFAVDIIDTWNMTITPSTLRPTRPYPNMGPFPMKRPTHEVVLPGKPYLAIRIRPSGGTPA